MSAESEDKIRDTVVWFYENRNRIPPQDLGKRMAFLTKAMMCIMEIQALVLKDIQELEQRSPRSQLWLPSSVKIDDGPAIRLRD